MVLTVQLLGVVVMLFGGLTAYAFLHLWFRMRGSQQLDREFQAQLEAAAREQPTDAHGHDLRKMARRVRRRRWQLGELLSGLLGLAAVVAAVYAGRIVNYDVWTAGIINLGAGAVLAAVIAAYVIRFVRMLRRMRAASAELDAEELAESE